MKRKSGPSGNSAHRENGGLELIIALSTRMVKDRKARGGAQQYLLALWHIVSSCWFLPRTLPGRSYKTAILLNVTVAETVIAHTSAHNARTSILSSKSILAKDFI